MDQIKTIRCEPVPERCQIKKRVRGPNKPKPPHPCRTAGCHNPAEGKALFCAACRHNHRLAHQQKYRNTLKSLKDDMLPEPPTSLQWLNKFSAWAKSGQSYAEYQKALWMNGGTASHEKSRAH